MRNSCPFRKNRENSPEIVVENHTALYGEKTKKQKNIFTKRAVVPVNHLIFHLNE